jgi:CRP-like cAMP-binding protein
VFVKYTPEEIAELVAAGSKNKKNVAATQEEKLFHSIKHVRLFDNIETTDVLNIITDVKIHRYKKDDLLDLGSETKDRIYYIISGTLVMPLSEESHVELGKDQIFGEVNSFTKTNINKRLHITSDNTMIFSFKINKNIPTRESAFAFVKFYEALMAYTANKLSWFEMA